MLERKVVARRTTALPRLSINLSVVQMTQQKQGILASWKPIRNFGLVVVTRSEVYFLHTSQIVKGPENPVRGSVVYFDIAPAREGGRYPQATNAIIVEPESGGAQ
jgi:hypothetical protein